MSCFQIYRAKHLLRGMIAVFISMVTWGGARPPVNLVPYAELSVSGNKEKSSHLPELVRDRKAPEDDKMQCWLSAKSKAPYLEFSWDKPKRAGELRVYSGYTTASGRWSRVGKGFELLYETPQGWEPVPGGTVTENDQGTVVVTLYPVAFKKLRLVITGTAYDEACIREVMIMSWDMSKKPPPPVSIGAKRFPDHVMRAAYELVRLEYGIRPTGRSPIPFYQLKEEADEGRTVYRLTGEIREVDGMKEVLVGKRGWVRTRGLHNYEVGDYVKFVAQISAYHRASNRTVSEDDKSLKRIYNDLTMNYQDFIRFLQQGIRFSELEGVLDL